MKLSTLSFDLSFPDIENAFYNAFTSAHMLAVNPLFIAYIALIKTINSPPGCKIFYCAEMSLFLEAVGSKVTIFHNTPSFRMRLQTSLDSAIIAVMSHSVFFFFLTKLLPVQNIVFYSRSGRSSLTVRAFAYTPVLSVLLGAGSGACVLRVAPATGLANPAILLAVTLRPRCFPSSAFPSSFAEVFQKPLTRRCSSSGKFYESYA